MALPVLTSSEMRAADADACALVGADALMRAAGKRIAELLQIVAPTGRVVAFAGPGNNGGDAFAALAEMNPARERIIYAASPVQTSDARREAEKRARAAGVRVMAFPQSTADARAGVEGAAVVLDALLGTGARRPLSEALRAAVPVLDARERTVVAIDIPSGIDADDGCVDEYAVRATHTIALAAAKPGLLLEPARDYVGSLWIAQIGIAEEILERHRSPFTIFDEEQFLRMLPVRRASAEKRSAGAPLVIAGSAQFPGAAVLCASAAARAGAGYVTVATSSSAADALRAHLVEQVVVPIADSSSVAEAVEQLADLARHNGSVAIGPGLGLDDRTGEIVRAFLRANTLPVVVDASALFHLAKHLDVLRDKAAIVTPHAGEFARLSGGGTIAPGKRVERLREFVDRTGVTTLLKGIDTLVYDGTTTHVNTTGTNALATAGTGDVLTGIIATLLAQGLSPFDAARAGAYWHGLAGRAAARERCVGVTAGDLPPLLAAALPASSGERDLTRLF